MRSRGERRRQLIGKDTTSKRDKKRYKKKWLKTIDWLNQEFPRTPDWEGEDPVTRVYIKIMEQNWGEARGYEIYISKEISWPYRFEILIHEWAHILVGSDYDRPWAKRQPDPGEKYARIPWREWFRSGHCDKWALHYGRIFRAYHTRREPSK